MVSPDTGRTPQDSQDFQAPKPPGRLASFREITRGAGGVASLYPVEYKAEAGTLFGVRYEPFTQLEEVNFSFDQIAEARREQKLYGKVYFIAGANPIGMGGAAAEEITAEGGIVVCTSRKTPDDPVAMQMMDRVRELGGHDSSWIQMDIRDKNARHGALEKTLGRYGRIDGVVLAVGAINDKHYTAYDEQELIDLYATNLLGPDLLLHRMLKEYVEPRESLFKAVEFASIAGPGSIDQGGYPGSKEGMNSRIRGLRAEYAQRAISETDGKTYNIYANSLAIGFVPGTEITARVSHSEGRRIARASGAQRPLDKVEVGAVTGWLLNPDNLTNGKVIPMVGQAKFRGLDERGLLKVA